MKIEKDIQKDGYVTVDAIKQYWIRGNNCVLSTGNDGDAHGVEVRRYVVD